MHKYTCKWLGSDETSRCKTCCGATNTCPSYENELGIDPFTRELINQGNGMDSPYNEPLKLIKGGLE